MGTRFEIVLWDGSEDRLQAAAREAFDEIERLHRQLSVFDPASDISDINARAAVEPVLVEPRLFALLERCLRLASLTHGAFDIAIGSLMEIWGFRGTTADPSRVRDPSTLSIGSDRVLLDCGSRTVRFAAAGVSLDLGGIAKGYALDAAADILRECGIEGALIHGGASSILGVGSAPDGSPWSVGIRDPRAGDETALYATVQLHNKALGVSAPHGRMVGNAGHVMDPRSGRPAAAASLAAVACDSATDADAFSTALLILGAPFAAELRAMGCDVWLVEDSP